MTIQLMSHICLLQKAVSSTANNCFCKCFYFKQLFENDMVLLEKCVIYVSHKLQREQSQNLQENNVNRQSR